MREGPKREDRRKRVMRVRGLWLLVVALGCRADAPVDPADGDAAALTLRSGLEYRAETLVMESFPVQLRTLVHVRNVGDTAKTLSFPDGCVVLVRAYREDSSQVAWDQGAIAMCTGALVEAELDPGESETFQTGSIGAAAILGDSLPDGRYRLEAYLRPMTGQVVVEAGSADLAIAR